MKKYLLITSDKFKFEITEAQKAAIIKAINRGDKLLEIQDSVISLAITPTIIEYSKWAEQENERLKLYDKRLCKKCGQIMAVESGCICWHKNERGEAPLLGETAKKFLLDNLKI